MVMPILEIERAIHDRMQIKWPKRLKSEKAAPVCCIGIVQHGKDFGTPVVCTLEDMSEKDLGQLLLGVANQLLRSQCRQR